MIRTNKLLPAAVWVIGFGVLAVLFGSETLLAYTPDGDATSTGGGSGGKTSVPGPFGLLFLALGPISSLIFTGKRPAFPFGPSAFLVLLGMLSAIGQISPNTALLFAIPLFVLVLKPSKQAVSTPFEVSASLLPPILAGIFLPTALPFALLFGVAMIVWHHSATKTIRSLLILSAVLAVCCSPTIANHLNPVLQESFTAGSVLCLNLLGFEAYQSGNTILGLSTSIHVTKACVGMSICANLVALSAFLTLIFGPSKKSATLFFQLVLVGFGLNIARIVLISGVGHLALVADLNQFHDVLGWFVAAATYGLMGAITFVSQKSTSRLPA